MENECNSYRIRVGKTTFIVSVKQAKSADKSAEMLIKDICRHEILGAALTNSQ